MAQDPIFAVVLATVVTAIAFYERRYQETIQRRWRDRLALARARDFVRGTAEMHRLMRETRLQNAVQRSTAYVVSASVLLVGLVIVWADALPS